MFSSFRLPDLGVKPLNSESGVSPLDADERNLFFVALTRAKHEVNISYAETRSDGREQLKSQFVTELKPELTQVEDTKATELAYQNDAVTAFAELTTNSGPSIHDKE